MLAQTEKGGESQLPSAETPLLIKGTEGMMVSFAECCYPIPGDPIVGIISGGEGLIVHAEQCPRIDKLRRHPDAYTTLRWDERIQQSFPALIRVEALDEPRLLARMAASIADTDAN